MNFHDELNVFFNEDKIGILYTDDGNLSFKYDIDYWNKKNACPLANNLPLSKNTFTNSDVESFFFNLLPDERVRDIVAKILHTSPENTFRLLKEIGADCAGAVSFYSQGQTPRFIEKPIFRKLSSSETREILDNLWQRPLDVGDEGIRISCPGSQDKLVACVENGVIYLPLYGTPSTHIIKPSNFNFHNTVYNEYFCMKLAKISGIPVADCDILPIEEEDFYVVKRFDRIILNGKTIRLHQEDFCQLLNTPPTLKYEDDGGPSVKDCIKCLKSMRVSSIDILNFFRLVIFNFLIGNCDAHAKNYAVLYNNGVPSFAPAYDLLCTMVYENLSRIFSMRIGGEQRMGALTLEHFLLMADDCEISKNLVLKELKLLASNLPQLANQLAEELNKTFPSPIYETIAWRIKLQCLQIMNDL